jgi:hypothetical protein
VEKMVNLYLDGYGHDAGVGAGAGGAGRGGVD